jgi:hypothetical protein
VTGKGNRMIRRLSHLLANRVLSTALCLVSCLAVPAGAGRARAEGHLEIEAELDRNEIAIADVATLTVTVTAEGVDLPSVALPPIPGATAERLGESQGFSWVNGRVTRTATVAFRLHPSRIGEVRIPALRVSSSGIEAQSRPLVLHVGNAPPAVRSGSSELFVRLTLDRHRAYWNQGVTARFTLYSRARIEGAPVWDPPDAPGFWNEVLGPVRTGRVVIGGAEYDASELRVAYFPTRTGRLTIGPGRVHVQVVRRIEPPDPWSALGMSETQVEELTLETERAGLDVVALPAAAPADFRGGVGSYSMDVRVDRASVHAGEPVTVTTTIRGGGNLASAGDPTVKASAPARSYAAGANTTLDRSGDHVRGERRHEVTLIPEAPGPFAVLPVRFTWFDPETAHYRTQVSDTISIRVLPAVGSVGDSLRAAREEGPLAALRSKPGPRGPLTLEAPFGAHALGIASILAYAGTWIGLRLRDRAERNPRWRRRRALEAILGSLEELGRGGVTRERASDRISAMILQALALRFDADLEGRSVKDALEHLRLAGAPENDLEEVSALLASLDRLAFAPPGPDDAGGARERNAAERLVDRYRKDLT